MDLLLTRDVFRETVFSRDGHKCVFCKAPAQDAHHIMERRLWSNGGYFLDNGASVCEPCHMKCEQTLLSVEEVREACGITNVVMPPHLYSGALDERYDKWGNPVLPNGNRMRGELFDDESVQKVLAPVLHLFTKYVKYGRTFHLPWSEGMHEDDRMMQSLEGLEGQEVVVTEKLDGENTTMYNDYIHARSIDGRNHESRNWVKNFWSQRAHDIPENWRVSGENLFAKHSIKYEDLPSYFMGFSIWNENNECLSWDETVEWFQLLDISHVPVLWRGVFNQVKIASLYDSVKDWATKEGYVVRVSSSFPLKEFKLRVGKMVRARHIQTTKHWMHGQAIEKNGLKA